MAIKTRKLVVSAMKNSVLIPVDVPSDENTLADLIAEYGEDVVRLAAIELIGIKIGNKARTNEIARLAKIGATMRN